MIGSTQDSLGRFCRIHSLNEAAFDEITEASAFFAGLLMTDGCISVDRRCKREAKTIVLGLQASDREIVEQFRSFLGSTHKISDIAPHLSKPMAGAGHQVRSGPSVRLSIPSNRLADRLIEFGITPQKTATGTVSDILAFNRHFWRGVISGDGTLSWHKIANRIRHRDYLYYLPHIGLVGQSARLLEQFAAWAHTITPDAPMSVRPNGTIYQCRTTGVHAVGLIRTLYGECTVALHRKLVIAQEMLAWNEKEILRKQELAEARSARRCSALGCDRPPLHSDGFCGVHSRRFKRNGHTNRVRKQWGHLTAEMLLEMYAECPNWPRIAAQLGMNRNVMTFLRHRLGVANRP